MIPSRITRYPVTAHSAEIKEHFDEMEGKGVSIAGRLMSKRGMGKVTFCDLQDGAGRIQLYVRRDEVGEEPYARFKKVDIGDIVGVKGTVFRTQRGEMSVRAEEVTLLSKSLLPLPEKFHGLTDKELRLPPAVCGPHRQPGGAPQLRDPLPLHPPCPRFSGRERVYGGGDAGAEHHLRRRHRPALYHPSQHPGYRYVYAHRHRAAAEAADRGRDRPGV